MKAGHELALEFLRVTEAAAIESAKTMGQGDRKHSDHVAVEAMRQVMDTVPMRGKIVIGEGERDEAPMLYIGEELGGAVWAYHQNAAVVAVPMPGIGDIKVAGGIEHGVVWVDELASGNAAGVGGNLAGGRHFFHRVRGGFADVHVVVGVQRQAERLRTGLHRYLGYVEHFGTSFLALMRGGVGADPTFAVIIEDTRLEYMGRLITGLALTPDALPPLLRTALRGWIGSVEAASLDWVQHHDIPADILVDFLVGQLLLTLQSVGIRPVDAA